MESAALAAQAGLADVSDVALVNESPSLLIGSERCWENCW